MYVILGLNHGGGENDPIPDVSDEDDSEFEQTNMQRKVAGEWRRSAREQPPVESDEEIEREPVKRRGKLPDSPPKKVPTKPFLKRGEGLKARFKVDPNRFQLDNLPKYKYANLAKSRAQNAKKRRISLKTIRVGMPEREKSRRRGWLWTLTSCKTRS